jgi:hypothetical protein
MVTRTGIESLGTLFATFRNIQNLPNLRQIRAIYKNPFLPFFSNFLYQ